MLTMYSRRLIIRIALVRHVESPLNVQVSCFFDLRQMVLQVGLAKNLLFSWSSAIAMSASLGISVFRRIVFFGDEDSGPADLTCVVCPSVIG